MSEFVRLQLIVGDDLNTSLWAMHADLEATSDELMRDLDLAAQHLTDLPSENPAIRAALHRFKEMVKLKLALPLAILESRTCLISSLTPFRETSYWRNQSSLSVSSPFQSLPRLLTEVPTLIRKSMAASWGFWLRFCMAFCCSLKVSNPQ